MFLDVMNKIPIEQEEEEDFVSWTHYISFLTWQQLGDMEKGADNGDGAGGCQC